MEQELKRKTAERMSRTIEALKKEFASVRTGRASLALLDGIMVNYYDTQTPLQQLANLSIPDSRQIAVQPWDQKIIPDIEKAIMKSDLGLTPMNDGKIIRINIPPLTEERRKQLVKAVKKKAEEAKISIRNIRRDANEELTNSNFILKVTDAKLIDIQKALQIAGIKVRSIIEVFKEEEKSQEAKTKEAE